MTIRPIIAVPDPRLKQVSEPVEAVTDDLRLLMDDMVETMHDAKGIGLAAIQVGVGKRVIVMDLSPSDSAEDGESEDRYDLSELKDEPIRYFVNPEIVWTSEEMNNYQEGCLSVPGFYDDVERPQACKVTYLDYQGEPQELNCDGLLATCIQHEMDHLNGVVFLDHLSRLKRDMIVKKLRKLAKEANVVESR
ncbi:MAG: peptide deformylase [Candidatus Micropelagos sp.]|jgi:peptide deformylase|uniref:Peptide deformylase n=1 Tax=PS1 clade bacterium TaxID=2175152 RepID=A0A368EI41_9PROT|nr:peptide deformylase [Hyphomicrobiales bacterium]MBL6766723.1 peptide deformylase [Candidatus Micropelagos sp.]NCG10571.1 peptide deformylase [Alphaproteobacteria bacterium]OUV51287.1 MAG: peptide deformylase [Alphaproteobacteria bacterium TMED110]RCL83956.1 MAG: peptide deformylase [PS1 clade bacterium]|tara:strand:- start:283 stop:858 length:576 start_codon:yes stop_codon:yes gene_type:complete